MQTTVPLACFLSMIRPPSIQFEAALLQIAPVDKVKCPFVRDINDVSFQLYTRHNPSAAHTLLIDDDERLFSSSIDFNDNTAILFLAFMETPDDGSVLWLREAYTTRGDTNVITVDTQRLEAGPWYVKAAHNTWYIGRIAAQFIDYLVSRGLKLSKTHLVGHSLGAQSAGVAGGHLLSGRVSRITGLDAALPLFSKVSLEQRLDPSDAEFVDVIHTDAGIFGTNKTELEGYYVYHLRSNDPKHTDIPSKIGSIISVARTVNNIRRIVDNISKVSSENENNNKFNPINILMKNKSKRDQITKSFPYNEKRRRQKRFASFFKRDDSKLLKLLDFFVKNGKNVIPVISVIRDINTIVKTANGELNHMIKEENNFIGTTATLTPVTYNIQFNSDSKIMTLLKKIFGFGKEKVTLVT